MLLTSFATALRIYKTTICLLIKLKNKRDNCIMSENNLDIEKYDLEYAELTKIVLNEQQGVIEITLTSPPVNWWRKEKLFSILSFIDLKHSYQKHCFNYLLTLRFNGVNQINETLISKGHIITGHDSSDRSWLKSFIFEIDEVKSRKLRDNEFIFCLNAEGFYLNFNYKEVVIFEKCID